MSGKPSLNPSSNLTQTLPNGKKLLALQSKVFVALQVYVETAARVPTTNEELKEKTTIDSDFSKFESLLKAYKNVKEHCVTFRDVTFPESVNCVSDIYTYGKDAPLFMGAVQKSLDNYNEDPEKHRKELEQVVNKLIEDAKKYGWRATTVKEKFSQFLEDTKNDSNVLKPIHDQYFEEKKSNDNTIKDLDKQIEDANNELKKYQDRYVHDVALAVFTPVYAWISPIGFVCAAVFAGIYGKRASDELDEVNKLKDKVSVLNSELQKDMKLYREIQLADDGLKAILDTIDPAIAVLGKIEGAWGAIAYDLENIRDKLKENILDVESFNASLGVEDAITNWTSIAQMANEYRQSAYIKETTIDEIQKNPDKYKIPTHT